MQLIKLECLLKNSFEHVTIPENLLNLNIFTCIDYHYRQIFLRSTYICIIPLKAFSIKRDTRSHDQHLKSKFSATALALKTNCLDQLSNISSEIICTDSTYHTFYLRVFDLNNSETIFILTNF